MDFEGKSVVFLVCGVAAFIDSALSDPRGLRLRLADHSRDQSVAVTGNDGLRPFLRQRQATDLFRGHGVAASFGGRKRDSICPGELDRPLS